MMVPIGYAEIAEICAGLLCLVLLCAIFVFIRKRYVHHKKHKPCVQDSNGYFPTGLTKSMLGDGEDMASMEMNTLMSGNNSDHSPFRSLKPNGPYEVGSRPQRTQSPVVCSVAPNLPHPPSSNSDNESLRKSNWDPAYEGEFIFKRYFTPGIALGLL